MSQYLLNIAARNTGNNAGELLPSKPVLNGEDTRIIDQDFTEANEIPDNAVQDQLVKQTVVPALPMMPQKVEQAAILNETQTTPTQKNKETYYFSKHIERVESAIENRPLKNKTAETISFKINEEPSQAAVENVTGKQPVYAKVFVNNTVSKITPEKKDTKKQPFEKANKKANKKTNKMVVGVNLNEPVEANEIIFSEKQIIQPADKTAEVQNRKINLSDNSGIERIIPNQPEQLNNGRKQNKKEHEAAPKLVIGKITVEMLPPKLPAPQKVIARVVQPPSKDGYSKSNKLIFGLGQL